MNEVDRDRVLHELRTRALATKAKLDKLNRKGYDWQYYDGIKEGLIIAINILDPKEY